MINTAHFKMHEDDCLRIVEVAQKHGKVMSVEDAYNIWNKVSDSYAAGWLFLPDDDDVLYIHFCNYIDKTHCPHCGHEL